MAEPLQDLTITKDERSWAMAAHALTFVEGGIIGPLILYLVKKDESEFIAFHALQSLLFGLFFTVVTTLVVVPFGLCTFGAGFLLLFAFLPFYLFFELYAVVKANEGEWYFLPVVGRIAWNRHHPGAGDQG